MDLFGGFLFQFPGWQVFGVCFLLFFHICEENFSGCIFFKSWTTDCLKFERLFFCRKSDSHVTCPNSLDLNFWGKHFNYWQKTDHIGRGRLMQWHDKGCTCHLPGGEICTPWKVNGWNLQITHFKERKMIRTKPP